MGILQRGSKSSPSISLIPHLGATVAARMANLLTLPCSDPLQKLAFPHVFIKEMIAGSSEQPDLVFCIQQKSAA